MGDCGISWARVFFLAIWPPALHVGSWGAAGAAGFRAVLGEVFWQGLLMLGVRAGF